MGNHTKEHTLKLKEIFDAKNQELQENSNISEWPFSVTETDPRKWRFMVEGEGEQKRHMWRYLQSEKECEAYPMDTISRNYLDLPSDTEDHPEPADTFQEVIRRAGGFHSRLQTKAGCWTADLSCIFFVTPMLLIAWYITGARITEAVAVALTNHAFAIQADDGGWPTYLDQKMPRGNESPSTLMGTLLMYVALRLLGLPARDPRMVRARENFLGLGGATYLPCWAKFWLCLLGLYDWAGSDPYPTDLWLLPHWLALSPWRWYCFTRQITLAMSYLWEKKFSCPSNPLLDEIREEIFAESYSSANFTASRNTVRSYGRQIKKTWLLFVVHWLLTNVWLRFLRPVRLARRGVSKALQLVQIAAEVSIGGCAVDSALNMIVIYAAEGGESKRLHRMQQESHEYFFMNELGGQIQSIHGGHTWETALTLLSMTEAGLGQDLDLKPTMQKAYAFLVEQQHLEDYPHSPPLRHFKRLGGWPFTTKHHGWVCSDCTGEVLKAILLARAEIDPQDKLFGPMTARIRAGVDNLLLNQNSSGGYSAFEPTRGPQWLERLNGTELFGKAMVEYDYIECTGSALLALQGFRSSGQDVGYRADEVRRAVDRGVAYLCREQQSDGSWLSNWGVAYTYAAFFALEALGAAGLRYEEGDAVWRGCEFLLDKQKSDGGWGETMQSIVDRVYTEAETSHTVQTAWSCLALMHASYPEREPIRRGIRLILSRQKPNGEWPQEQGVGCGILTTQIQYQNYIFHFPMRAISMYARLYGDEMIQ